MEIEVPTADRKEINSLVVLMPLAREELKGV
jgi:hypothetical protein